MEISDFGDFGFLQWVVAGVRRLGRCWLRKVGREQREDKRKIDSKNRSQRSKMKVKVRKQGRKLNSCI